MYRIIKNANTARIKRKIKTRPDDIYIAGIKNGRE